MYISNLTVVAGRQHCVVTVMRYVKAILVCANYIGRYVKEWSSLLRAQQLDISPRYIQILRYGFPQHNTTNL